MGRRTMQVMQDRTTIRGIQGLIGREPVGAVLSVGKKGPSGNPVEKDRFHLLDPMPDGNNRRHPHPRFKPFNDAEPADRRVVVGQLVHQSELQCFGYKLLAYRAKGHPSHPRRLPFCEGDGIRARRYVGLINEEHTFEDIVCPNDKCEFRVRPKTGRGLGPATCKPWSRLLFRILWNGGNLPSMLVKYTTGGWATTKNMIGLFDQIRDMATMVLGNGRPYTLGGFEFTMTLGEGTNPEQHTRYPVVTFAPLTDPIHHFMGQVDRYERIGKVMGPPLLESKKEPITFDHEPPEQDGQDFLDHMPGVE